MFSATHSQSRKLTPASSDKGSGFLSAKCEPFPIKAILLAALLPPLLGLLYGIFIVPPQIGWDAAAGLRAWVNFTNGGTWNTISVPDPSNIAQVIEVAVTWWPPGQYLFLGLLSTTGLTFAHAALLLTFLCSLSGSIGSAALARELGAPIRALPWIAAVVACTSRNLAGFHGYWNGEPLIMALWPWVAAIAWRLRNKSIPLVCTLPILFLIGSYIKYSFAVYAICILLFLWSEKLIGLGLKVSQGLWKSLGIILKTSLPLVVIGVIYIMGRDYFIGSEGSPIQEGAVGYGFKEILAYTPIMPLTSVADLQDSLIHIVADLVGKAYHEAWLLTASSLAYISPFVLILYLWFVFQRKPMLRFLGITALVTVGIFSVFYIMGYTIGLRERYYQQAAILLLIAASAYGARGRRFSRLVQVFLVGIMAVGVFKFTRTTYANLRDESFTQVGDYGFSFGGSPSLVKEVQSIGQRGNSIIAVPSPVLALELDPIINLSAHILPTYGHGLAITYKGRVSQVTIVELAPDKRNLKERFVDYAEDEWRCYTIGDWIIWQTEPLPNGALEN